MLFRFNRSRGQAPAYTLIRPSSPTLDLGNPHNDGLLLFVYDNNGEEYLILADSATGQSAPNDIHYMAPPLIYGGATIGGPGATNPATLPSAEASDYGPAFRYAGHLADSSQIAGFTVWSWPSEAIRDAQNLYNKAAGAAFSYEAYFQYDGANADQLGFIFGRGSNGWTEQAEYASAAISAGGTTMGNRRKVAFSFYEHDAVATSAIVSPTEYATGQLIHAVGSCVNTDFGLATVELHVNGVTVASASNRAIRDQIYQTEDAIEGQVQMGSYWHVYANHVSGVMNGKVFAGAIYNRAITEAEALEHYEQLWDRFE